MNVSMWERVDINFVTLETQFSWAVDHIIYVQSFIHSVSVSARRSWWSDLKQGTFPSLVLVCLPRDDEQVNFRRDISAIMLKVA